jgi:hypothetical protein
MWHTDSCGLHNMPMPHQNRFSLRGAEAPARDLECIIAAAADTPQAVAVDVALAR